jgi:acetoin utilization protein AcuB
MHDLHVRRYMTVSPHTLEPTATYSDAGRLMREHHIRHLPVIDSTVLVGVVTDEHVALIAALKGTFPDSVQVGEIQGARPYTVAPDADLQQVARELIENKQSCAVVLDKDRVVGVFTLIDALRALVDLTAEARRIPQAHGA